MHMAATTPGIPDSVLELIKYVHRYGLLFVYKRAVCKNANPMNVF